MVSLGGQRWSRLGRDHLTRRVCHAVLWPAGLSMTCDYRSLAHRCVADDPAGYPPKMLQEIMGHASITTPLDLYGHLDPGEMDATPTVSTRPPGCPIWPMIRPKCGQMTSRTSRTRNDQGILPPAQGPCEVYSATPGQPIMDHCEKSALRCRIPLLRLPYQPFPHPRSALRRTGSARSRRALPGNASQACS